MKKQDLKNTKHDPLDGPHFDSHSFDDKLCKVLDVPPPSDLMDRLMMIPEKDQPRSTTAKRLYLPALAASVILAFGIMVGQSNVLELNPVAVVQTANIDKMAIDHYNAQRTFLQTIDENVSLRQVNSKLAPFGSKLTQLPGHVYYVNHCVFGDKTVFQMIVGTDDGKKVNIYMVPQQQTASSVFGDSNVSGVSVPFEDASLIILSEDNNAAEAFASDIDSEIQWELI